MTKPLPPTPEIPTSPREGRKLNKKQLAVIISTIVLITASSVISMLREKKSSTDPVKLDDDIENPDNRRAPEGKSEPEKEGPLKVTLPPKDKNPPERKAKVTPPPIPPQTPKSILPEYPGFVGPSEWDLKMQARERMLERIKSELPPELAKKVDDLDDACDSAQLSQIIDILTESEFFIALKKLNDFREGLVENGLDIKKYLDKICGSEHLSIEESVRLYAEQIAMIDTIPAFERKILLEILQEYIKDYLPGSGIDISDLINRINQHPNLQNEEEIKEQRLDLLRKILEKLYTTNPDEEPTEAEEEYLKYLLSILGYKEGEIDIKDLMKSNNSEEETGIDPESTEAVKELLLDLLDIIYKTENEYQTANYDFEQSGKNEDLLKLLCIKKLLYRSWDLLLKTVTKFKINPDDLDVPMYLKDNQGVFTPEIILLHIEDYSLSPDEEQMTTKTACQQALGQTQ